MTNVLRSDPWPTRAACAGQDTNLWFPRNPTNSPALQTCRTCPVRPECLLDALHHEPSGYAHRFGIRGGLTAPQRRQLPALPSPPSAALTALRELFDRLDAIEPDPTPAAEGTDQPMTTIDVPTEGLSVSQLLKWGDGHPDTEIQAQAARARAALAGLRQRHAADEELTSITTEAQQLEKRLAELRAREAELAPKPKKKRTGAYTRDYDTRTVRTWAAEHGVDCPRVGQIPKRVLDAWRTAQQPTTT